MRGCFAFLEILYIGLSEKSWGFFVCVEKCYDFSDTPVACWIAFSSLLLLLLHVCVSLVAVASCTLQGLWKRYVKLFSPFQFWQASLCPAHSYVEENGRWKARVTRRGLGGNKWMCQHWVKSTLSEDIFWERGIGIKAVSHFNLTIALLSDGTVRRERDRTHCWKRDISMLSFLIASGLAHSCTKQSLRVEPHPPHPSLLTPRPKLWARRPLRGDAGTWNEWMCVFMAAKYFTSATKQILRFHSSC